MAERLNAVIAASGNLSAAVPVNGNIITKFQMPASWTTANLTFQVSMDGVTYSDIYDSAGAEKVMTAAASRAITPGPSFEAVDFIGIKFLKIRSGTAATPVTQTAERVIGVLVENY